MYKYAKSLFFCGFNVHRAMPVSRLPFKKKERRPTTSGTPSRRLRKMGRGPGGGEKVTGDSAAKSGRRASETKRRRSSSGEVMRRRTAGAHVQRGGLRDREASWVDPKRLVNNKLIDPLEFKAPPKKKKLADTDWAKYGRPAPRIRKDDRPLPRTKLDAEAVGIVSRALDNVYRIVVGSPKTETSSVVSDRETETSQRRGQREIELCRGESRSIRNSNTQGDGDKSEEGREGITAQQKMAGNELSPAKHYEGNVAEARGEAAEHREEGRTRHRLTSQIEEDQSRPEIGDTSLKTIREGQPLPAPQRAKEITQQLLQDTRSSAFVVLGRPVVKRQPIRSAYPPADYDEKSKLHRKEVTTVAPAAPREESAFPAGVKGAPHFPSRKEIAEKMAANKLDLSKVRNKHKNAPVPTLSPREIQSLESEGSTDEDEMESSRSPNLEHKRASSFPLPTGSGHIPKAKPSFPPGAKSRPQGRRSARSSQGKPTGIGERRLSASDGATSSMLQVVVPQRQRSPEGMGNIREAATPRSARKMVEDLKDAAHRGEENFNVVGRAMNAKVLEKAKREGAPLDRRVQLPGRPGEMPMAEMVPRTGGSRIGGSRGQSQIGAGKPGAKKKPTSDTGEIAGGQKNPDWIQAKRKLWSALRDVNEVAEKAADGFVCIPLHEYEAMQGKRSAAATGLPTLRQLPQYPGVRGNFDGLWRLWLQQELRYGRISPHLTDSIPSVEMVGQTRPQDLPPPVLTPPCAACGTLSSSSSYLSEQPCTYRVLLRHEEKTQTNTKDIQPLAESGSETSGEGKAFLYDVVRVQEDTTNQKPFSTKVDAHEEYEREGFEQGRTTGGLANHPQCQPTGEYPTLLNTRKASSPPVHVVTHTPKAPAKSNDGFLPSYPLTQPEPIPQAFEVYWAQVAKNLVHHG